MYPIRTISIGAAVVLAASVFSIQALAAENSDKVKVHPIPQSALVVAEGKTVKTHQEFFIANASLDIDVKGVVVSEPDLKATIGTCHKELFVNWVMVDCPISVTRLVAGDSSITVTLVTKYDDKTVATGTINRPVVDKVTADGNPTTTVAPPTQVPPPVEPTQAPTVAPMPSSENPTGAPSVTRPTNPTGPVPSVTRSNPTEAPVPTVTRTNPQSPQPSVTRITEGPMPSATRITEAAR